MSRCAQRLLSDVNMSRVTLDAGIFLFLFDQYILSLMLFFVNVFKEIIDAVEVLL